MIRLSLGTAIELGLMNKKSDITPTTAYIMIGNKCNNNCSFCSQSIESNTRKDKLSRVIWPSFSKEEVLDAFINYKGNNIKRICVQSMASDEAHDKVKQFIDYIKDKVDMPISLSAKIENKDDVDYFFANGVDKMGIAIDVANEHLYESIKGNNYKEKVQFILDIANKYKGKISSHIIVGLGETHQDICELYYKLRENDVTVSLFAFTPVRGTKMENISQPSIINYRRVQLMTYMIDKGYKRDKFKFKDGNVQSIELDENIKKEIEKGSPFEIRGCKNCNRPYYNERPGGVIYNYSRKLTQEDIQLAIDELDLGGLGNE